MTSPINAFYRQDTPDISYEKCYVSGLCSSFRSYHRIIGGPVELPEATTAPQRDTRSCQASDILNKYLLHYSSSLGRATVAISCAAGLQSFN